MAGVVFAGEKRVEKPGDSLPSDAAIEVRGEDHPYVSRGGVKLAGALDQFALHPQGWVCVDVGRGQLHQKLRTDPRVVVLERTNARTLTPKTLGLDAPTIDLAVADASFIGLEKLLPAIVAVLRPGGALVALVKPQFQVKREEVGKGGVVRDDALRLRASAEVADAARALGLEPKGECDCVIAGPEGNRERFLYAVKRG